MTTEVLAGMVRLRDPVARCLSNRFSSSFGDSNACELRSSSSALAFILNRLLDL